MLNELGFRKYAGWFSNLFKSTSNTIASSNRRIAGTLDRRVSNLGVTARSDMDPASKKIIGKMFADSGGNLAADKITPYLNNGKMRMTGSNRRSGLPDIRI